MADQSVFNEDYFLRGKQTGKSLYEDYRWLPELTIPMAQVMVNFLGIEEGQMVLDFGCARGYLVRALRELDIHAYGYDASRWAIENADSVASRYMNKFVSDPQPRPFYEKYDFSWVIAKDVLEHVEDVDAVIDSLKNCAMKGVFAIVPLAHGPEYDVPEYEQDVTHIHRWSISRWASEFCQTGWSVDLRYRVPGIKDNYKQYPTGNGFLTCRRLSDS